MKKIIAITGLVALVAVAYSCKKNAAKPSGTLYLDLPATTYQYSSSGAADKTINNKATLGRVLFYDTRMSLNNAVSCASCHKQSAGFADNTAFSRGFEGRMTGRNSPVIVNITGDSMRFDNVRIGGLPLFWDGRETVLKNLVARPITNHLEMGINDFSTLPDKLAQVDYYNDLFNKAYGDEAITGDRISECVAMFLASIKSSNTRFDQFMGEGKSMMSPSNPEVYSPLEYAGYNLFINKYQCQNCHHVFTSTYTQADFKDIGLEKVYTDKGVGAVTLNSGDNGKFRVPQLRNIALSAPYMHDGRYKTLGEVIDHYSSGIQSSDNLDWNLRDGSGKARQMNISETDKQAMIAFLNTFTDYTLVTDPKYSNPFKVR